MTLSANITKLAALGATVSGVKSSFDLDAMPSSLQPALLPALLFFPDGGSIALQAFDALWEIKHRVRVQIAYAASAQGSFAKNVDGVVDILDRFLIALRLDEDLTGSCASARATGYTRIGEFIMGGVEYFGIEIVVEVLEYLG